MNLTDDALAGDPTVFVSATAAFTGAPFVRISGGTADDEYVTVLPYQVVTGADGYGRLPPITRVAAIELGGERTRTDLGPGHRGHTELPRIRELRPPDARVNA